MPSTGTVGTARLLLAAVVLGTIATTSTVALALPERAAADVEIPEFPTGRPAADPADGMPLPAADDEIWGELSERMRESVREACAADRLGGPVCEQV